MNTIFRITIACFAVASITLAAGPAAKRLTPKRLAELTAASDAPQPQRLKVEISGLDNPPALTLDKSAPKASAKGAPASVTLPADKPEAVIEFIREFRFPVAFEPPQASAKGEPGIVPMTPTAFETVNTGWTISLSAKPSGKFVALYGIAEYVTAELVPGGYGAITAPIYAEDGKLITPNKLDQPKFQTTTTRFHIFAVPGEPTEVTLYRGAKGEKHTVTVTTE